MITRRIKTYAGTGTPRESLFPKPKCDPECLESQLDEDHKKCADKKLRGVKSTIKAKLTKPKTEQAVGKNIYRN